MGWKFSLFGSEKGYVLNLGMARLLLATFTWAGGRSSFLLNAPTLSQFSARQRYTLAPKPLHLSKQQPLELDRTLCWTLNNFRRVTSWQGEAFNAWGWWKFRAISFCLNFTVVVNSGLKILPDSLWVSISSSLDLVDDFSAGFFVSLRFEPFLFIIYVNYAFL